MFNNTEKLKRKKFELFFRTFYPKVRAYAFKLLKSEADAEDIAQDIFVQLWELPNIWEDTEKYNTYIFTMVKNHILNFFKREEVIRKYEAYLAYSLSAEQETNTIYDEISAQELKKLTSKIISEMPPKRREVFLLSRLQGLANKEISEKMGLSLRTVEHHLYLASVALKKEIFTFIIIYSLFFK